MKLKKLLALLLSLCLLLNFTACDINITIAPATNTTTTEAISGDDKDDNDDTSEPDDSSDNAGESYGITPLLYKVTDDNGNVIWLFGSIHIGKEYFYPLPDYVMNAYNSSDSLAVEFDVTEEEFDDDTMMDMLYDLAYTDGSNIEAHIPEELYNDAKEILEDNDMYFSSLDFYMPYLWSMFIDEFTMEQLDYETDLGIDMFFLNTAHDGNKTIHSIESMEFQMNMMTGYSHELQEMMLESSVYYYNNVDEYSDGLDELAEAWAEGDAEALADEEEYEFESEEEKALYYEYNTSMMTKRNRGMTNFAEDKLFEGEEVFIVVGAAHVVGEDGMANQLRERGYTVEVIQG